MTDGGEGYFSARKVERLRVEQDLECSNDVFVIIEWLAHAHKDDVCDASIESTMGDFLSDEDLLNDFACR